MAIDTWYFPILASAKTFSQRQVLANPAPDFTVSAAEAGQLTEHKDCRLAYRVCLRSTARQLCTLISPGLKHIHTDGLRNTADILKRRMTVHIHPEKHLSHNRSWLRRIGKLEYLEAIRFWMRLRVPVSLAKSNFKTWFFWQEKRHSAWSST